MLHLLSLLFSIYCGTELCRRDTSTCETLHFDDIELEKIYGGIPENYHDFVFERDSAWPDRRIGLINTSFQENIGIFTKRAPSLPNAIVTWTDSITLRHRENKLFDVIDIHMVPMLFNQYMQFEWGQKEPLIVYLPHLEVNVVSINQTKVNRLVIRCVKPYIDDCGHMLYDNFRLCLN